jgi:hypothetical protein
MFTSTSLHPRLPNTYRIMAAQHDVSPPISKELFSRIPRELRDLIYAEVLSDAAPVSLRDLQIGPGGLALLAAGDTGPDLKAEILEALYTHGTLIIPFSDPRGSEYTCCINSSTFPQLEEHIRKAVILAEESELPCTESLEHLETLCRSNDLGKTRAQWEGLLRLPRLEHLTIRLQKKVSTHLSWADFSPIIVQLRKNLPKLKITFTISFDTLLERVWYDPIWENNTEPGNVQELPYDPMGFVDVTELIQPPTVDDFTYVEIHIAGDMSTYGRDIVRGLLDETAALRRGLAMHYVVKDPELLRVRITEHYEVYSKMKIEQT